MSGRSATRRLGRILGALLFSGSAWAAQPDQNLHETLRELGRAADQVTAIRAAFVQEKHVAIVRDVLRSSGTFLLDKRSGRVAWQVTEPEPVRIVISKQGVFAGGKLVTGGDAARFSPLPMLQGMTDLFGGISEATARSFEVTLVGRDRLRLKPRSRELSAWMQAIEITVDAKTKTPRLVHLEEPGGDVTEISFRDVVVNPKLDDTAFAP